MQNGPYVTQTSVSRMQIGTVGSEANPVAVTLLRKFSIRQQKKFYLHFRVPGFNKV